MIELALQEEVGAVLLAGDIYDGGWRDYNTGLYFVQSMKRLRDAGIEVFLVHGNHDAESQITRQLTLPDNVHVFPTGQPDTVISEHLGVAVHGQGFAQRDITENLAVEYPVAVHGLLNVGLLHTALTVRAGHDRYAPCSVRDLSAKGYEYWALGHVHSHEIAADDPWVVFPGNLQGRHIKETGAKGCVILTGLRTPRLLLWNTGAWGCPRR